jgi:hypothetical protein
METLQGLVEILVVMIALTGALVVMWAIVERPSSGRLKHTIYFALCGLGLMFTWSAFLMLFHPHLFGAIVSLAVVSWLAFLAKEKFYQ